MAKQLADQETQIGPSDVYDDTLPPGSTLETNALNLRDDENAQRSIVKRIIHGLDPGNWFDDPVTIFGVDVSLKALFYSGVGFDVDDILTTNDSEVVVDNNGNVVRRK